MKGSLIVYRESVGTCLGVDNGDFFRADEPKPEQNVRKIKPLHSLENLSFEDIKPFETSPVYGTGWGSAHALRVISKEQFDALISLNEAKRPKESAPSKDEREHGWCPKCESYCFGDCSSD